MELLEHARQTVAVHTANVSDEFVDRGRLFRLECDETSCSKAGNGSSTPAPEEPQ